MQDFIDDLKKSTLISEHPYFRALSSGEMSKETFVRGQLDFYRAVIFFTRPMMRLASRLEDYHQRWPILENIIEEHGSGVKNQTHGAQFRLEG